MTDIGSWGFKGAQRRGLELPSGSSVALSQSGRATIRYNESTNDLEISRDGGVYEAIDIGGVPAGSPWTKTGTIIHEVTLTDTVAIGVATMSGSEKLRVVGDTLMEGDVTLVGAGTLTVPGPALFNGDVTLGNASGDAITVTGRVAGDIIFAEGVGHNIEVAASTTGSGDGLDVEAGNGAAGDNSGGFLRLFAGLGTGTAAGGAVSIFGGPTGSGTGGDVSLNAGSGGAEGDINIGTLFADNVNIGKSASSVGFYGVAAVVRQTITGAKGGNVALGNVLSALAALGLVIDSTTA